MATPTDPHGTTQVRERPSQGIFIGWLSLVLFIFAVLFAATGIVAGAVHGFH
jgi:hypothetical protein